MQLVVVDVDTEVADERGRRRLFIRVAAWWGDAVNSAMPPDAVLDFLLPAPPTVVRSYDDDVDGWRRRTRSNKLIPATPAVVEVDGEWVPMPPDGPPGDPWRIITTPIADPLQPLWPIIDDVARARRQQGWKGPDTFAPGEVNVDAAHRQTAAGKATRATIGARRTIGAA